MEEPFCSALDLADLTAPPPTWRLVPCCGGKVVRAPWLGFGLPHPVGSHHPASASEAFAPCLLLATSGARADQIGAGACSSEVNAASRGAAGIIARRGGGGGGRV